MSSFRLITSKDVKEYLEQLQQVTNLTPNILARIAVALSLKMDEPIEIKQKDTNGREFLRHTLTGEYDYIFKAIIAEREQRYISDDEYFPELFNAHLARGVRLLSLEYQYAGNYEKLITNLLNSLEEEK